MSLFDQFERTDRSPAEYGEDSFSFINRVHQRYWQRVRDELDSWFADYPGEHAADLRARFRARSPAQHFGAWWELYLHQLFRRLGYDVSIHPQLLDASGRPDFRVTGGGGQFLLEAATTFSGIVTDEDRHGERESWIKSAINEATNPNFFVALEFNRVGKERPTVNEIVSPIEEWLGGLDPDQVSAVGLADAPELRLQPRDWDFVLTAIPIKPEARGKPGHRLLGIGPMEVGYVNDLDMITRTLDRKRRKYGKPEEPMLIAMLLMSPFMDNEEVEQALLGRMAYQFDVEDFQRGRWVRQRNGFWVRGADPRNTRISAVMTGTNLMPWNVATVRPRLWPNPWATRPLQIDLPFPKGIANEQGVVRYEEIERSAGSIFGLPTDWPGPEAPFEGV